MVSEYASGKWVAGLSFWETDPLFGSFFQDKLCKARRARPSQSRPCAKGPVWIQLSARESLCEDGRQEDIRDREDEMGHTSGLVIFG